MHVKIAVFNPERKTNALARDCGAECGRGVEIESVAELVAAGSPARLDACGQMLSIVASIAGLAQRSEQIAQRFKSEEVETFVGHLEANRALGLASPALYTGCLGGIPGTGYVVLLFHALDELFDQFIQIAALGHLVNFLLQVFVEEVA